MKFGTRHIKCFSILMVLLCVAIVSVNVSSSTLETSESLESSDSSVDIAITASLSEKEDNMLNTVREMGKWGIPSSSVTLQGTIGCTSPTSNALQRILRAYTTLCACIPSCLDGSNGLLNHSISTKRFHSRYYLYYRCQMRC